MGPIGFPETSERNYHYSLGNNPEERSSTSHSKYPVPLSFITTSLKSVVLSTICAVVTHFSLDNCGTVLPFSVIVYFRSEMNKPIVKISVRNFGHLQWKILQQISSWSIIPWNTVELLKAHVHNFLAESSCYTGLKQSHIFDAIICHVC